MARLGAADWAHFIQHIKTLNIFDFSHYVTSQLFLPVLQILVCLLSPSPLFGDFPLQYLSTANRELYRNYLASSGIASSITRSKVHDKEGRERERGAGGGGSGKAKTHTHTHTKKNENLKFKLCRPWLNDIFQAMHRATDVVEHNDIWRV